MPPPSILRNARRWLRSRRLMPQSVAGKLALLFSGLFLILFVLQQCFLALGWSAGGNALNGWTIFASVAALFFLFLLAARKLKELLLWRLRNRLIVTYIFIGVIPVLLLAAMTLLAAYLFAGQLAIYFATTKIQSGLESLETANQTTAAQLATELAAGENPAGRAARVKTLPPRAAETLPVRKLQSFVQGAPVLVQAGLSPNGPAPPEWVKKDFTGLVVDQGKLYMRSLHVAPVGPRHLTLVSSVLVDKELLDKVAAGKGEVTFATDTRVFISAGGEQDIEQRRQEMERRRERSRLLHQAETWPTVKGGSLPVRGNWMDRTIDFRSPMQVTDWKTGDSYDVVFYVSTRPSLLYAQLFYSSAEVAVAIRLMLVGVAVLFACLELFALIVGLRLSRTITRSVSELYEGTQRVNRGDFSHRIAVKRRDQLAALERSFNSMSSSLEKLIAEQKEKQRLENELAIAQEVQGQLFPRGDFHLRSLELHGLCRPARTVSGDYYDFLPVGANRLGIAVGDISGKGISAALLMATVHSAVRVFEMGMHAELPPLAQKLPLPAGGNGAGVHSPGEVLGLLNRHLLRSTPAEKYATLFLGMYDDASNTLTYSNGGHLPPLIVHPDGSVKRLDKGGTVVGLLDQQRYDDAAVRLEQGDILLAYSDGVTEPENEFGEFGERRLLEIVREHRQMPLARLSEMVTAAVDDWIGSSEQPDDVTLVLARVR